MRSYQREQDSTDSSFFGKLFISVSTLSVTFLGSGTSQGVPMIACNCDVCQSTDPRDKRMRCSIYLETQEGAILVDTTPELRVQSLRANLQRVDSVLLTHAHADHLLGFDDIRRFCEINDAPMPVYAHPETLEQLQHIFGYAFNPKVTIRNYVRVDPRPVTDSFFCLGLTITPLEVTHGKTRTCGFLFEQEGRKKLAYFSDCKTMPEETASRIDGVEVLVIDGLRDQEHPTHMNVAEAIATGQRVHAGKTWLTHITHHKSHMAREADLPPGFSVAYDELRLDL